MKFLLDTSVLLWSVSPNAKVSLESPGECPLLTNALGARPSTQMSGKHDLPGANHSAQNEQ